LNFVAKKRQHSETTLAQPYQNDFELRKANIFNEDLIASTRDDLESPQPIKFKVGTRASDAQPK
jgi:hypothetical protein